MKQKSLFKIIFWVLTIFSSWFVLKQCGSGRISEAFADADAGLRTTFPQKQQNVADGYWMLQMSCYRYVTPQKLSMISDFKELRNEHRSYQLFLDSIRAEILSAAGLSNDLPLSLQIKTAHHDVVKHVLLEGNPNLLTIIAERTDSLRSAMLKLTGNEKRLKDKCSLDFTASADGQYFCSGEKGDFRDLPLAGALAILSNIQSAAFPDMLEVLNYCIGKVSDNYCGSSFFTICSSAESSYILPGDHYIADFSLGAYPYLLKNMKVEIDGKQIPVNNGIAHYEEENNGGLGYRVFKVKISGNTYRYSAGRFYEDSIHAEKEFGYYVRQAHPQIHRPDFHPFLYAYVENPISVSSWNNQPESAILTAKNAKLIDKGGGYYSITPYSLSVVHLVFGSQEKFEYPVRLLPDLVLLLEGYSSGKFIPKGILANRVSLQATFPTDFDFPVDCKILDFHVTRFRKREDPEEVDNQGSAFNSSARNLLETALPGDRLVFDEVRVLCGKEPTPRVLSGFSARVE